MKNIKCLCGKEIIFNDEFIPNGQKTEIHCLDCGAIMFYKKPTNEIVNDKSKQ